MLKKLKSIKYNNAYAALLYLLYFVKNKQSNCAFIQNVSSHIFFVAKYLNIWYNYYKDTLNKLTLIKKQLIRQNM